MQLILDFSVITTIVSVGAGVLFTLLSLKYYINFYKLNPMQRSLYLFVLKKLLQIMVNDWHGLPTEWQHKQLLPIVTTLERMEILSKDLDKNKILADFSRKSE